MTTLHYPATLLFAHIAIEAEIHKVWKEISEIRVNPDISDPRKSCPILRLREVHNRLEIESMRQQDDYLQQFLKSLKLDEIGARPMTGGKRKCHLTQQFWRPTPLVSSGILVARRKAIRDELTAIARKPQISAEGEERRHVLSAELRALADVGLFGHQCKPAVLTLSVTWHFWILEIFRHKKLSSE
jgi:hypothetical protein